MRFAGHVAPAKIGGSHVLVLQLCEAGMANGVLLVVIPGVVSTRPPQFLEHRYHLRLVDDDLVPKEEKNNFHEEDLWLSAFPIGTKLNC